MTKTDNTKPIRLAETGASLKAKDLYFETLDRENAVINQNLRNDVFNK